MMDFLKKIGLESDTVIKPGTGDEITVGLESIEQLTDLAITLLDAGLEANEDSVIFNKVSLVDNLAGLEGADVDVMLSAMELLEPGMESLKEAGARTWYRIKAAFKALLSGAIAFFKKLMTLGGMTDKILTKLAAKVEKVKERWNNNANKVSGVSGKKYSTWTQNVTKDKLTGELTTIKTEIEAVISLVSSGDLAGFVGKSKTELDKLAEAYKKTSKEDKASKESLNKSLEALTKDLYKTAEFDFSTFKGHVKGALDVVESVAKELENIEVFAKIKEGVKNAEAILKELNGLKADEIATALGKLEVQEVTEAASGAIKVLSARPKDLARYYKVVLTVADKTFTEVEKVLSNN
ncbi:MAG: hypothetical protein ACRCX8_12780 [Sarcina sp.]